MNVNAQRFLPEQALLNGVTRAFRSISWPQYFLHEARLRGIVQHEEITPWVTFYRDEKSAVPSIDYAYYGALSTNDCHDQDYGHRSDCDRASVYKTQENYRRGPQDVVDVNSVQVPGLQKQVELFYDDLQTGKITVDDETAVIVWVGGNDIAFAAEKIQSLRPKKMYAAIQALTGGIVDEVSTGLQKIMQTPKLKHLYVMNMYDLGLAPKVYRSGFLSPVASSLTQAYNLQLSKRLKELAVQYPEMSLQLYDTYSQFDMYAHSDLFKENVGRQCDENREYLLAAGSPLNCGASEEDGAYLFWNNAHPSTLVDQFIAHGLFEFVLATWGD